MRNDPGKVGRKEMKKNKNLCHVREFETYHVCDGKAVNGFTLDQF